MPNLRTSPLEGRALLDIESFARHGPTRRDQFSPEEVALIGRTIRRMPEVMVKVLSKGSNNLRSVVRHLNYIGRRGQLELETDDGTRLQQRDAGHLLVEDWDLDLDEGRGDTHLSAGTGRVPKLVHKMMLSMPPRTPAKGVLEAARNFAREEFALKHRYALVLHTDEPHPHVHVVVKALSEQGERLNIRKATLREWRRKFAQHLRDQGIAANATERAIRGETRIHKMDGIYRASRRGESSHVRARTGSVAAELLKGHSRSEPGKSKLMETRKAVELAWRATGAILASQGHPELAADIHRFLAQMPLPQTEREQIATALRTRQRDLQSHLVPPATR